MEMFEDMYELGKDVERIKIKLTRIEEKLDTVLEFITRHGHGTPGLWAKGQPSHVQEGEQKYEPDPGWHALNTF